MTTMDTLTPGQKVELQYCATRDGYVSLLSEAAATYFIHYVDVDPGQVHQRYAFFRTWMPEGGMHEWAATKINGRWLWDIRHGGVLRLTEQEVAAHDAA